MFRNSQQHLWRRADRWQPANSPLGTALLPSRSFVLTKCRCKTANINARNYYDLLGVERTASQKEIRKAFVKLSKEYHPDANSSDKSLHEKFVKINEAFGVLSKQSTRRTYDQTLDSPSRPYQPSSSQSHSGPTWARPPPAGSPFDWTARSSDSRGPQQRRSTFRDTDWGTPHYDKTFYDLLRRKMQQDRKRQRASSHNPPPGFGMINTYFVPFSIISFLIGFGILIHVLQGRMVKFSEPDFAVDPRSRSYQAYREWQRLSALKEAPSMSLRDSSSRRDAEK